MEISVLLSEDLKRVNYHILSRCRENALFAMIYQRRPMGYLSCSVGHPVYDVKNEKDTKLYKTLVSFLLHRDYRERISTKSRFWFDNIYLNLK